MTGAEIPWFGYLSQAHITHKSNPMISSSCLTGTGSSHVNSLKGHKDCFQQMLSARYLSFHTRLSALLVSLGHKKCAAKKEAEKIIRWLGSNGDGYIDLDDILNVITNCGSEKDDLMDAFLIFDIDENGFISAKKLNQVLTGLGSKQCDPEECFLMMKGVDKDGNGLVD
ncbi:PREDICTED: probable calcium-binding protein CML25 [Populus euphratica]|uniref:Probable calcium-binding protein CML25 n=1 Tax=Populus euphratica TaxID=75702 RepID=A0AAJ6XWN7_POPEU|nr:PREDICTED: probable calcium-binding protein CML25 [Populus euphratica]